MNTFTEENYLKAIYSLSLEKGSEAVSTNAIADKMKTKASSVTDMVQRLSEKGLLTYQRYQGVHLTPKGRKAAVRVVRKHRLWEVFLVKQLGFKWDQVHELAEQLEHIQSEELIEKLDTFLGYPKYDPHGDPIPDKEGRFPEQRSIELSSLQRGKAAVVTGVKNDSVSFLKHLEKINLQLGDELKILDEAEFDRSLQIAVKKKSTINISSDVARNIIVREK